MHQKPNHMSTDICIFDAVDFVQYTRLPLPTIAFQELLYILC